MEKKKPNRKSIPVTISMERELLGLVDSLADAQNLTRSQFIERQVRNGIDQEKAMVAMLANPRMVESLAKAFGSPGAVAEMRKVIGTEVSDLDVEKFNRAMQVANLETSAIVGDGKKGKGKRS